MDFDTNSSVDELIARGGDADLCRAIFLLISEQYGHEISVDRYSVEERIVMLVDHARGIIRNGGFQYLFEGDFPGDPAFRLTLRAFKTLGCEGAAEAFRQALAIFPNSRPPTDIDARLDMYQSVPYSDRKEIDEQFWSVDAEIEVKLAQYIRDHRRAFSRPK